MTNIFLPSNTISRDVITRDKWNIPWNINSTKEKSFVLRYIYIFHQSFAGIISIRNTTEDSEILISSFFFEKFGETCANYRAMDNPSRGTRSLSRLIGDR